MNAKPNPYFIAAFWLVALWFFGLWKDWWQLESPQNLVALIALAALLSRIPWRTMRRGAIPPPPSPALVDQAVQEVRSGQRRSLRHLHYRAGHGWTIERADDMVWTGVSLILSEQAYSISLQVSSASGGELRDLESMLVYAQNHFAKDSRVVRNEVGTFAGRPCVITEFLPAMGKVRRIGLLIHGSEYGLHFYGSTLDHFSACEPIFAAFEKVCTYHIPKFPAQEVLGGRIAIGIPPGWRTISKTDDRHEWQGEHGIRIALIWLEKLQDHPMDYDLIRQVPGISGRHIEIHGVLPPHEGSGAIVYGAHSSANQPEFTLYAVRTPSGKTVALEVEHKGSKMDDFAGLLRGPFVHALVASIEDTSIPIL